MILRHSDVVKFDASVKEHREAVKSFLTRMAWADTKLRFAHDPEYGSVAEQVQSKLLHWYISQEKPRAKSKAKSVVG